MANSRPQTPADRYFRERRFASTASVPSTEENVTIETISLDVLPSVTNTPSFHTLESIPREDEVALDPPPKKKRHKHRHKHHKHEGDQDTKEPVVTVEEEPAPPPPSPPPQQPPKPQSIKDRVLAFGKRILCRSTPEGETPQPQALRTVHINRNRHLNTHFSSNSVSTTKYSILTFLPKFFFEQFGKASNFFFLFAACVAMVPQAAVINPVLAVTPLLIVIGLTAIKELYEDFARYKADQQTNNRTVQALRDGSFVTVRWQDVVVGDILLIKEDESFCADVILLSTSEPHGICFVETATIDGETNLKIRRCTKETRHIKTSEGLARIVGQLQCEPPNNRLYTFEGLLQISEGLEADQKGKRREGDDHPSSSSGGGGGAGAVNGQDDFELVQPGLDVQRGVKQISLGPNELVLRGSSLQNTAYIHGMVVYTGHETKLFRNANAAPIKQSNVQSELNKQIIILFAVILGLSAIIVIGRVILQSRDPPFWYADIQNDETFVQFIRAILLFQNIIPLTLFFQLEIVRFIQGLFINFDDHMFDDETKLHSSARTTNLNEQLGLVSYLFSDKTGTLTQNKMLFQRCVVGGVVYGGPCATDEEFQANSHFDMRELLYDLANGTPAQKRLLHEFLINLAVCQTVIPEEEEDEEEQEKPKEEGNQESNINETVNASSDKPKTKQLRYRASSPDEHALVIAARDLGYIFKHRTPDAVIVEVNGVEQQFDILQVNDFNSTRKRMSVVVGCPDGRIMLYCKGADSMILERLSSSSTSSAAPSTSSSSSSSSSSSNDVMTVTNGALLLFSRLGLRTLCLASRELDHNLYAQWREIHRSASEALVDRPARLDEAAEWIERDMTLLGATAIEDKLQEGVPETIATLLQAGIKIWVLTGDKQETAINIGLSCRLLDERTELKICNFDNPDEVRDYLQSELARLPGNAFSEQQEREEEEQVLNDLVWHQRWRRRFSQWKKQRKRSSSPYDPPSAAPAAAAAPSASSSAIGLNQAPLALVIDGATLLHALQDDLKDLFLSFALHCRTVICCRVSPAQKATVVALVKERTKQVTLAVGDGANDVGMIQAASIGVGIHGQEGGQAVRASDYTIAQFRFLQRLLLLHGSWNYHRQATLILYQFYIQMLYQMVIFLFQCINYFSMNVVYQPFLHMLYFTAFTGLPIAMTATFDRHLSEQKLFQYPEVYRANVLNPVFTTRQLWLRSFFAFSHALIIFSFVIVIMQPENESLGFVGSVAYTSVMLNINLFLMLVIVRATWIDPASILLSFILYGFCQWYFSTILGPDPDFYDYYGIFDATAHDGRSWFAWLLVPTTTFATAFAVRYIMAAMYPTDWQILNEIDHIEFEQRQAQLFGEVLENLRSINTNIRRLSVSTSSLRERIQKQKSTAAASAAATPAGSGVFGAPEEPGTNAATAAAVKAATGRRWRLPKSTFAFSTPENSTGMPQSVLIRLYGRRKKPSSASPSASPWRAFSPSSSPRRHEEEDAATGHPWSSDEEQTHSTPKSRAKTKHKLYKDFHHMALTQQPPPLGAVGTRSPSPPVSPHHQHHPRLEERSSSSVAAFNQRHLRERARAALGSSRRRSPSRMPYVTTGGTAAAAAPESPTTTEENNGPGSST